MIHDPTRRRILATVPFLLLANAPVLAQGTQKVTLMLNWYATGLHAPFFLGKEKGYFAKEGIDLEIQEGRGSSPTVQAVAGRNVTFGFADVGPMIKLAAKGAPVISVGIALQKSPYAVISLAEKKILKPSDLKGKTIALTPGDSPSQAWPLFLKKTGLKESDFKTVSGDAQTKLNAVITGQADALAGFSMDQGVQIEAATKKPVTNLLYADHGVNSAGAGIIANTDTVKDQPELVRKFMRAVVASFEEAEKSPEAAVAAEVRAMPKAGDPKSLLDGLKTALPLFHPAEAPSQPLFRMNQKTMDDTLASLVEIGGIDASAATASKYFTNDFLP